MEATYRLKPSELNEEFIKAIKKFFKDKELEITISSKENFKKQQEFIKAVEDVKLRKNLVSFSVDEFKSFSEKLVRK